MDRTLQKEHLGTWLSQLNEREQKIMKLRFGLDGEEPLTPVSYTHLTLPTTYGV